MSQDDRDEPVICASPPCFMNEVDPAYIGLAPDEEPAGGVIRWRKAERERLIQQRLAIPADVCAELGALIADRLDQVIGEVARLAISAYWPSRGEPDIRNWMDAVTRRGARTALPVVVKSGQPLVFRAWQRNDPLERGIWNISVPSENAQTVLPDVVIAPVVGFDPACYRLGYGGGFYDRTPASLPTKPRVIGVGYGQAALATIYPQAHDIAMDLVVTDRRIVAADKG